MTASAAQQGKKRRSLNTVFSAALAAFFCVFVVLIGATYYQFFNVKQELERLANKAIPEIILFDEVAKKAAFLAFHTEQIANAQSMPALQLAQSGIDAAVKQIETMVTATDPDDLLQRELQTIQFEIDEMAQLVTHRLSTIAQVSAVEKQMYRLFEKSNQLTDEASRQPPIELINWSSQFSKLIILTASLMNYNRLNEIRAATKAIEQQHQKLAAPITRLPAGRQPEAEFLLQQFSRIVLAQDSGVIALRVRELRIDSRTTGRGYFIEKLAFNFARTLSLRGALINQQSITNAQRINNNINQQIKLLWLGFAVALLLSVLIAMVLRRRVISRLIMLNGRVSRHDTTHLNDEIVGNDEITDIEQTFADFLSTIDQQKRELSKLAMQDGLTGIANRRAFDSALISNLELAYRCQSPLALLILDVDFFKSYNDSYGHQRGDDTLIRVASTIENTLRRKVDFVARYGGEEFVCLLPATDTEQAKIVAKHLRKAVQACQIEHRGNQVSGVVTVSIGGAVVDQFDNSSHLTPEEFIKLADKALYVAKNRGRNQYRFAGQ